MSLEINLLSILITRGEYYCETRKEVRRLRSIPGMPPWKKAELAILEKGLRDDPDGAELYRMVRSELDD